MSLQEIALDETTCSGNELLQEQSFEQKSRKLFWILGRRVRSTLMLQDFQIGKEYELYEDGDKLAKVRVITPPHKTKNGSMRCTSSGWAVLFSGSSMSLAFGEIPTTIRHASMVTTALLMQDRFIG